MKKYILHLLFLKKTINYINKFYKNNIRASKNDFTIIYNFFYDKDNFYLERVVLWKLEREN